MAVIGGGPLTKAGVPTSGVAQVETAQIVGTITTAGNATFTVTSTSDGLTDDATSNDTTAGVKADFRGAPVGTVLADTTNGNLYQNTGSANVPTWTLL